MLTQITLEKRDNYQYGESYTMRFDFNGEQTAIKINEQGYNALRERCEEITSHGQFEQDEKCILLLVEPVVTEIDNRDHDAFMDNLPDDESNTR